MVRSRQGSCFHSDAGLWAVEQGKQVEEQGRTSRAGTNEATDAILSRLRRFLVFWGY